MTQRPIRFRAWDKKAKEIICVSSINLNKDGTLFLICGGNDIHSKCKECEGNTNDFRTLFEDYILMQWTGLLDKSGVGIYEGYIVSYWFDSYPYKNIKGYDGYITNDGCAFWLNCPKAKMTLSNRTDYKFEVIGNVYENPELLTKGE